MNPKRYLRFFGAAAVGLLVLMIGGNFIIDPYDVFHHRILPRYGQVHERFLKIEFLKKNPVFDTFILGSSRVSTTATEDVAALLEGAKVYNLAASSANQWDNLMHARWLLGSQPRIKRIFIQVDYPDSFGPDKAGYTLFVRMHPEVVGGSRAGFYRDYLTSLSFDAIAEKIRNNLAGETRYDYSIEKGYCVLPAKESRIRAGCQAYIASEPSFSSAANARDSSAEQRRIIDRNMEALREILRIASEKSVSVEVYTPPYHRKMLDRMNEEDFTYFIRALAGTVPFYNFSYYSAVSLDSCNYYESSHYRRGVGALLFRRMLADGPKDFGRRVTLDAIEGEIRFLGDNFRLARAAGHVSNLK
jgi:hypothetical protein